jgi:hypothetical protein
MKIYSKTGRKWSHDLEFQKVQKIHNVDLTSDDVIYYHHPYDSLMLKVPLKDCLNAENWQHIKTFKNVQLIHENDSETFSLEFAEDLKETINTHTLGFNDLKVIVMDENHKEFLDNYLEKFGFRANIVVDNYLLKEVSLPKKHDLTITHKFSSLSRNYRDWRALLYLKLLDSNILEEHFRYSFFNIWPYQDPPKVFEPEQIVKDVTKLGFTVNDKALSWLQQCPHELDPTSFKYKVQKTLKMEAANVQNKWSNITYDTILSADFHVVIETHYDQAYYSNSDSYDRDNAPTSITEKTYKAIACKRPFIAFSTPYMLADLRNMGYKTFDPYIDESYDTQTDNKLRINMIVDEITRICNLPPQEYANVLEGIKEITEYNYNKLVEKQNA